MFNCGNIHTNRSDSSSSLSIVYHQIQDTKLERDCLQYLISIKIWSFFENIFFRDNVLVFKTFRDVNATYFELLCKYYFPLETLPFLSVSNILKPPEIMSHIVSTDNVDMNQFQCVVLGHQ